MENSTTVKNRLWKYLEHYSKSERDKNMKFVKSSFAKKIIILLIVVMISNMALPLQINAVDVAGILFKPISQLCLSILVTFDVLLSSILNGISLATNRRIYGRKAG